MSKEKQIEEMAEMLEIIENARETYANDITDHTENEYIREGLLNAGYRKQSEGEWEEYQVPPIICCSECDWGTDIEDRRQFRYCPNCGAKMQALKGE